MSAPTITSFLVKLASRCNLDCDYCYVYHHADQSWRSLPKVISAENRAAFCERLATYVREAQLDRCVVVFHGGEPLLAGVGSIVDFACELRAAVGDVATVDIGLQTNGLLLSEEVLSAFEAADIAVSLSLDGPQEVNDLHRRSRKGRSSFARVSAALERLKDHPKIFAGVIAVIDASVSPQVLFEFFDQHRPPKLDFLLPDAHHFRPPPGRNGKLDIYSTWLIDAFDLWFDRYPHLSVRTFEALLDSAAGLQSGTDAFGLGDVSLITIETDGTYHDLDVLKVVGEGATRLGGSVTDTGIATVAGSPAIAAHRRLLSKDGLSQKCRGCSVVDICGGGSLPHRFGSDGYDHPSIYCAELFALITHVKARLFSALSCSANSIPSWAPSVAELAQFERAEDAQLSMHVLNDSAAAASHSCFIETVRAVAASTDSHAADALALLELSDDRLHKLAERPGSVSWCRAYEKCRLGHVVYSVDGKPLAADGAYLAFLRGLTHTDDFFEVGLCDEWLRKPFGEAIVFEEADVKVRASHIVDEALNIIEAWRPAVAAEMRLINRSIQFVRDLTADPEKIVSFSDNAVPGALFVSVVQGGRLIDPYDLADSLVHEHRHQKLYLLERRCQLVEATSDRVVSPWRDDLRPPSGLLHAVFVFVELRRLWQHLLENGPERLRGRAINQLFDTNRNLAAAYETLETCRLTDAGKMLVEVLKREGASELV